ncbi:unnamed protein product [Hymenolepis diminuta]|uniref:Uncharacterized protein n=1 Tax=Hymenolepis diminuta TaxID=6216 RepID=A0A564YPU1_HYMDI|nr:unnamed protein product [Hymenolepis diminuta]
MLDLIGVSPVVWVRSSLTAFTGSLFVPTRIAVLTLMFEEGAIFIENLNQYRAPDLVVLQRSIRECVAHPTHNECVLVNIFIFAYGQI